MGFTIQKMSREVPDFTQNWRGRIEKKKAPVAVGGRWPLGVIKIRISAALQKDNGTYVSRVRKTMRRWEACVLEATGKLLIKFVEFPDVSGIGSTVELIDSVNTGDLGYLKAKGTQVGVRINQDPKAICVLPHELGHTIGLAHEHERPDAPGAVAKWVGEKGGGALARNSAARYDTHGTPFDAMSIMMYRTEAMLIGHSAETFNNTQAGGCVLTEQQIDDQTWHPSPGDLNMIRLLYS